MDELLELGRSISSRASAPRAEIVFTGAKTAALAEHVYAPHDTVPMLLETLVEDLKTIPDGIDSAVLTAVIGFYCARTHPFLDGNGRWSRTVAASNAHSEEDSLPSIINIAFQRVCEREISTRIWPRSQRSGLRSYIEAAIEFEGLVVDEMDKAGFCELFQEFCIEIYGRGSFKSSRKVIAELVCSGSIEIERMRDACGISNRIVKGLRDRFENASGFIRFEGGKISIEAMLRRVSEILDESKIIIFRG